LTCENNIRWAALWACFSCAAVFSAPLPFSATQEITGNDIYSLAGHGDTLWMVTRLGANFTFASTDSLVWRGYKSDSLNYVIGFGDATALLCLRSSSRNVTADNSVAGNRLWLHRHSDNADLLVDPGFTKADSLSKIATSADFSAVDVAWSKGAFWLACKDGGLVRITSGGDSARAVFPGSAKWVAPSQVTDTSVSGASFPHFPDTTQSVIAVKVRDASSTSPQVWVATPSAIWEFTPDDTSWEQPLTAALSDPSLIFVNFRTIYVPPAPDSSAPLAAITVKKGASSPEAVELFYYDAAAESWVALTSDGFSALSFGGAGEVYVAAGVTPEVYLFRQENVFSVAIGWYAFQKRMTMAAGANFPKLISDVLFLQRPGGPSALWIATADTISPSVKNGLFYSLDEKKDELDTVAFRYVHSDKKLQNGLKETYAYPGILNAYNGGKAFFAYNLSTPSKVTISIYDWNMDLVKTVIKDKDRPAGNDRINGRSTNTLEDFWDGTNASGKRVAVGVYYYKLTARSGEHSFGKIIVAK